MNYASSIFKRGYARMSDTAISVVRIFSGHLPKPWYVRVERRAKPENTGRKVMARRLLSESSIGAGHAFCISRK